MDPEVEPMNEAIRLPVVIRCFDVVLKWISLILGGITLFFMMFFIGWNTLVMRKAMNSPIQGAEDVLMLTLVAIVALSIPFGARTGAHIEIEVMERSMSASFAKWSMIFVKILGMVLLAVMSWRLYKAGVSAARFGETTQQLLIPFGPFYYALCVSTAAYSFVLALDIWQLIRTDKVVQLTHRGDVL